MDILDMFIIYVLGYWIVGLVNLFYWDCILLFIKENYLLGI